MRTIIVAVVLSFFTLVTAVFYAGRFDEPQASRTFLDRRGQVIGTLDPAHQGVHHLAKLDDIPGAVIEKTIRMEDRFFRWHRGINPFAIAKAVVGNVRAGRVMRGGSTITQQLAKLLIQEREGRILPRTLWNKANEAVVAMGLELRHQKRWILERYLNSVYYGRHAYGIAAAADVYFGKDLAGLTEDEIDYLVRLPRAPNRNLSSLPFVRGGPGWGRSTSPFPSLQRRGNWPGRHFIEYVHAKVPKGKGAQGLVRTTLDLALERKVEGAIRAGIEGRIGDDPLVTAAAVVIDVRSGDVLSMAGSRDYLDEEIDGQVNAAAAPRQPGSALKPFTYFAAFAKGFSPDSIVPDEPVSFAAAGTEEAQGYAPQNFDRRFHGDMTIREALANSYNVPAVVTLNEIGLSFYHDILKKFGFTTFTKSPPHYGLAVTLGSGEVTLLELTNAYAVLARGGVLLPYRIVKEEDTPVARPVLDGAGRFARDVTLILSDPDARLKAFGFNESMVVEGHRVAVKTGTSYEHRDNWAVGYSPSFAVGVWVGHADGSPMDPFSMTGATGAAPIWHAIMEVLLREKTPEDFTFMSETVADSKFSPALRREAEGTLPTLPKGWRVMNPIANTVYRIHSYLPLEHQMIAAEAKVSPDTDIALRWYLDDEYLGTTDGDRPRIFISPEVGRHRLSVESNEGEKMDVPFCVVDTESTVYPLPTSPLQRGRSGFHLSSPL